MNDNEMKRQYIGVFLLTVIIFLSGYILYSQKSEPIKYVPASGKLEGGTRTEGLNINNSENNSVSQIVNINKASLEDLDTLPGIGEKTAQKIIDHRGLNGAFQTKESIMDVSGIGESKYDQIRDLISI